jgi:hypothetical protein
MDGQTQFRRNFRWFRVAAESDAKPGTSVLQEPRPLTQSAWDPVQFAQAIQHGPAYPKSGVGLYWHAPVGIELLRGLHQPDYASLFEILL